MVTGPGPAQECSGRKLGLGGEAMSAPKHILVAERDQQILAQVAGALRASGYATSEAMTGREALRAVQMNRPDLVIVGMSLPDIGGRDLARILESNGDQVPIRTLIAAGPGAPADDFAHGADGPEKPVLRWSHVEEIVTSVNETFDLARGEDPDRFGRIVRCGGVSIDPTTMTVEINGIPIELTNREFRFLQVLALNEERTCTREELKRLVWGDDAEVIGRTVDVLVSRLRSKLTAATGREIVSTIRGIGYRFTG
jgi:DNA-binding response OmpR family regulator